MIEMTTHDMKVETTSHGHTCINLHRIVFLQSEHHFFYRFFQKFISSDLK